MTIVSESSNPSTYRQSLEQAVTQLAGTFAFAQYQKQVLSQDGYVFWVKTANVLTVEGILQFSTSREQAEDQTIGINAVTFTAKQEVTAFNQVGAGVLWIFDQVTGSALPGNAIPGSAIPGVSNGTAGIMQVAFSSRSDYFQEADLFHYAGFAVYPAMAAQLVASAADLPVGPIVSNSLPIWLAQNSIAPVYPSFLVPENIQPPYIVAHIEPSLTETIQPVPLYPWTSTDTGFVNLPSDQLMRDTVKLIFYGFTNAMVLQFQANIIQVSLNEESFGFSGELPVIRDEKREQAEIAAIAMKKSMTFGASYYQSTADAIARRLIISAAITYNLTI